MKEIRETPPLGAQGQGKAVLANTLDRTTKPLAELASEINREHELAARPLRLGGVQ